jgi:hypothetical protein
VTAVDIVEIGHPINLNQQTTLKLFVAGNPDPFGPFDMIRSVL